MKKYKMEKLEVALVETKEGFELWVEEFKFAIFTYRVYGRLAKPTAVAAQNSMWKMLNYFGKTHPIKAVRKIKSL